MTAQMIQPSARPAGILPTLPDLMAEAAQRSVEFEQGRRLTDDYVAKLKAASAFKILVPKSAGGLGGNLSDWFEVVMALAEADTSTGWVAAHANICAGIIYASADPRFRDEFFADPKACAAWSSLPRVQVTEEPDGLRISGSWGFESGCTAATYVGGMVTLLPKKPELPPRVMAALAPISDAKIVETWDPVGLAGSGSHDVHFDNLLVPWHRVFYWPAGKPRAEYPQAVFVPGNWFIAVGVGATHLGLARRALDEARKELRGKVDRYFTQQPLLEHPAIQRNLEAAEGMWFACRAGMREALNAVWESGLRGEPASAEQRLNIRVASVTAVQRCAEIVRTAYDTAGASAIHRGGVLQRLLRDASCLIHHVSGGMVSYEQTGRVRCGIDPLTFKI
jgi:alkylation response protein AidB-like acyl-CoA dehydrogenase